MVIPLALALTSAGLADFRQSPAAKGTVAVQVLVKVTVLQSESYDRPQTTATFQACDNVSDFLSLLDEHGSFKVMYRPAIRTFSGLEAKVVFASRVRSTRSNNVEVSVSSGPGMSLSVTPTVRDDGTISMDVASTITRPSVELDGKQTVSTTTLQTSCRLKTGQTAVIKDGHEIIVLFPAIVKDKTGMGQEFERS